MSRATAPPVLGPVLRCLFRFLHLFVGLAVLFALPVVLMSSLGIKWKDAVLGASGLAMLFVAGRYLLSLIWARDPSARDANLKSVPKDTDLRMLAEAVGRAAGVRGVKLRIRLTSSLNASALQIGRCKIVVVTAGLLNRFSPAEVTWVLAHEYGHLRNHDALPAWLGWWADKALFSALVSLYWWLFAAPLSWLARAALPSLLASPVVWVVRQPFNLVRTLLNFISAVFLTVDTVLRRSSEFRADDFACAVAGTEPGIRVLSVLSEAGGRRPWLSGHPDIRRRIERIRRRVSG